MTMLEQFHNAMDEYLKATGHLPEVVQINHVIFPELFAEDPNAFDYKDNSLYMYGVKLILVKPEEEE
jgi:hypothetical protein